MRAIAFVALGACASPSGGGAVAPAPAPAPTAAIDAAVATEWTAIPALGVRIRCKGTVEQTGDVALVTCCTDVLSIAWFRPAKTLDDAIAELRASASYYLESTGTAERRSAHVYRHDHHNTGGSGENYWSDSAIEIGSRYFLCIAGGVRQSAAAAARGGDLCATLEAAP